MPLLSLLLAPAGCGPEYEVLTTPPSQGGTGIQTGGTGTVQATGGTEEGGNTSTGGVSTGGGTSTGGSGIAGTGMGGTGMGGVAGEGASGGESSSCMGHTDCPFQETCVQGLCTACPSSAVDCSGACPSQQIRVLTIRNGCAICECAPPSECTNDNQCAAGEVCYRGEQCDDDCADSLECCYGNHCGASGCSGPPPSCNLSGCEGGGVCEPSCIEATCTCNGMEWLCSETGMGTGGSGGAGEGGTFAIGGNACQGQCVPP